MEKRDNKRPGASGEQSAKELEALLLVSAQFVSLCNVAELLEKMTDCLIDIFQADRGVLLATDARSGKPRPLIVRGSTSQDPGSMSHTVIQRVARSRQPVLVTNVAEEGQLAQARSIVQGEIRSIVCAPLVSGDRLVAVVYLDSQVQRRTYGEADLALIQAFALNAAHLIENAEE